MDENASLNVEPVSGIEREFHRCETQCKSYYSEEKQWKNRKGTGSTHPWL